MPPWKYLFALTLVIPVALAAETRKSLLDFKEHAVSAGYDHDNDGSLDLDWSKAIQIADDHCRRHGLTLWFPESTYLAYGVRPTCNWEGDNHSSLIKCLKSKYGEQYTEKTPQPNFSFVRVEGQKDISIKKMAFDGALPVARTGFDSAADRSYGDIVGVACLYMLGCTNVVIEDCEFRNSGRGPGVRIESCGQCKLIECHSKRSRGDDCGDGFFTTYSDYIEFRDCSAFDFTRGGFVAEVGSKEITFTNCHASHGIEHIRSPSAGFYWERSEGIHASGCTVDGPINTGFKIVVDPMVQHNDSMDRFRLFELSDCVSRVMGTVHEGVSPQHFYIEDNGVACKVNFIHCFYDGEALVMPLGITHKSSFLDGKPVKQVP